MGLYDQLLGVTQQGLNNIEQTAQLRSQQPTFADVFMDRFRQAGQDQLARQKAAEEARMHEATMKNMEAQRLIQGAQMMSLYGTPENQPMMQAVGDKIGMPMVPPVTGLKTQELTQKESQFDRGLKSKEKIASESNDTKAYIASLKPEKLSAIAQYAKDVKAGKIPPDKVKEGWDKILFTPPPTPVSAPIPAVRKETNEEVLLQPKKEGGVIEVPEYAPPIKPGQTKNKQAEPEQIITEIDKAIKLLPRASSGGLQAAGTKTKDFFGIATGKSGVDAQLKTISAFLTSSTPRLGGSTSDADRKFYEQYMGDAANTNLPAASRIEALRAAKAIVQKSLKRRASDQQPVVTFEDFMK